MKFSSKPVPVAPEFEPIEITIRIESKSELAWLWACVNCGSNRAEEATSSYIGLQKLALAEIRRMQDTLFLKIDDIVVEKGLKD